VCVLLQLGAKTILDITIFCNYSPKNLCLYNVFIKRRS